MIGIFDSGIGGLSVFREIKKILPEEKYIYYSDNAHCPYGEKSKEYIIDRARSITDFLIEQGADIIVVACNTATAAAIKTLREEYSIPFIGMEPAIKPAAAMTKTGIVGVLATAGTLKAEKYRDTKGRHAEDVTVVEHIGKGFVELVESGLTTGQKAEAVVAESLEPLLDAGADTIVLQANCGRAGEGKRQPGEVGISSMRMGNIVGIHEVHISTGNQTLMLRHEAHDRGMFADGAIDAARFLVGKKPGLYTMENLLEEA